MSKNVVKPEATNDVTVWCVRVARWISKATRSWARTHTQICNSAFLPQQWLRERV